jgi:transcriptional adapter 2-alpha
MGRSSNFAFSTSDVYSQEILSVPLKCGDCPGDINMCIECLATAVEAAEIGHQRHHRYRVMDNRASFVLFEPDWTAEEELQLLEGIELYGMGNWK